MTHDFIDGLAEARLLAIIRGADAAAALASGTTLIEAGVRYLEVSLVTTDAADVIRALVDASAGRALVGAGTVLTTADVDIAAAAGARFIVTPAVSESLPASVERGLPVIAGALTPSECVAAMAQGATAIKLFPASSGGPDYLSALRDPLPRTPFVPVGGVGAETALEYLRRGALAVGVGSPLLGDAVSGGDLGALVTRAERYLAGVASVPRNEGPHV